LAWPFICRLIMLITLAVPRPVRDQSGAVFKGQSGAHRVAVVTHSAAAKRCSALPCPPPPRPATRPGGHCGGRNITGKGPRPPMGETRRWRACQVLGKRRDNVRCRTGDHWPRHACLHPVRSDRRRRSPTVVGSTGLHEATAGGVAVSSSPLACRSGVPAARATCGYAGHRHQPGHVAAGCTAPAPE
jgi:hypothetical protein